MIVLQYIFIFTVDRLITCCLVKARCYGQKYKEFRPTSSNADWHKGLELKVLRNIALNYLKAAISTPLNLSYLAASHEELGNQKSILDYA